MDGNGNLVAGNDTSGKATNGANEKVTSPYYASRPLDKNKEETFHPGVDIVPMKANGTVDKEASILSVSDGKVFLVGNVAGFGPHTVVVQNESGNFVTYGHMSSANVKIGDKVSVGDVLGTVGNEGMSSGTHLHLQESSGGAFYNSPKFNGFVDPGSH